jgi:hypothetical protein
MFNSIIQCSNKDLSEMTPEELQIEKAWYQAKIDGPENNHRITAGGSMDLDHWFDMIEDIETELKSRLIDGAVCPEKGDKDASSTQ